MLSRRGMAPSLVVRLPDILWDDRQRAIVLNQRIILFRPEEYAIVRAVYDQGERWLRGEAPRLLKREDLAKAANVPVEKLYRTICRASHKLEPHDWIIGALYSWGYGLFSVEEVGIGVAQVQPVR
jgi:hypothetical protein